MINESLEFAPVNDDPEYTGILPLRDVTSKQLDAIWKSNASPDTFHIQLARCIIAMNA